MDWEAWFSGMFTLGSLMAFANALECKRGKLVGSFGMYLAGSVVLMLLALFYALSSAGVI